MERNVNTFVPSTGIHCYKSHKPLDVCLWPIINQFITTTIFLRKSLLPACCVKNGNPEHDQGPPEYWGQPGSFRSVKTGVRLTGPLPKTNSCSTSEPKIPRLPAPLPYWLILDGEGSQGLPDYGVWPRFPRYKLGVEAYSASGYVRVEAYGGILLLTVPDCY